MCIASITNSMQYAKPASGHEKRQVDHQRISDTSELEHFFNFGPKLGNGCFGIVMQAQDKMNGEIRAIKIIIKAKTKEGQKFRSIERELIILKMVNHSHIIHLEKIYESPTKFFLILELCREELAEAFKRKLVFTEDETRYVLTQLVSAVCYLHKHLIIHRDLKLENILLANNPINSADPLYIKVSDFGLGIVRQGIGIDDMLHDCCGTLTYMAPEMLSQNYNQQCDVWSMGIIMYLLSKGEFPFFSNQEKELMKSIRKKEPTFSGVKLSPEGIHLLTKMLTKNPIFRIASSEIEQHPWILNQRISQVYRDTNIVDMMRMWKDEMMTPVGNECDWIAMSAPISENDNEERNLITHTNFEDAGHILSSASSNKKSMQIQSDKSSCNNGSSHVTMDVTPKLRKTQQSNYSSRVVVVNGGREKDEKSIRLKSASMNKDRKTSSTGTSHQNVEQTNSNSSIMKKRENKQV